MALFLAFCAVAALLYRGTLFRVMVFSIFITEFFIFTVIGYVAHFEAAETLRNAVASLKVFAFAFAVRFYYTVVH